MKKLGLICYMSSSVVESCQCILDPLAMYTKNIIIFLRILKCWKLIPARFFGKLVKQNVIQNWTIIICKLFANKNCLHFSANKIVRKQMDANNANNFSKHIGIKVEIFWVKLLNFQWNQLQKTIIWPKIIIGKFICIKWYQKMQMAKVKEFTRNSQV